MISGQKVRFSEHHSTTVGQLGANPSYSQCGHLLGQSVPFSKDIHREVFISIIINRKSTFFILITRNKDNKKPGSQIYSANQQAYSKISLLAVCSGGEN